MTKDSVLAGLLLVALQIDAGAAIDDPAGTPQRHVLPMVVSTVDGRREGFVRIVNLEERDGTVTIRARDDRGVRSEAVTVTVAAGAVASFNAHDLEQGNSAKALSGGLGLGQGDWRLELETTLDILPLAFVRTSDGFVTNADPLGPDVTERPDGSCFVPFFNPGSNVVAQSSLRLDNSGDAIARVAISARDDLGTAAPAGGVVVDLPAGEVRTIPAGVLESGASDLEGRLGDGAGKWRLQVSADASVGVINLLEGQNGSLVTVSSCEATDQAVAVVINDEGQAGVDAFGADPYQMNSAAIEGDTLLANVSYAGGCADHVFTLVVADRFMESDPVRLTADIAHDGHGDLCEAWLTEDLRFDLTPIKSMYERAYRQKHGTVVLLLDGAPSGELIYEF